MIDEKSTFHNIIRLDNERIKITKIKQTATVIARI